MSEKNVWCPKKNCQVSKKRVFLTFMPSFGGYFEENM